MLGRRMSGFTAYWAEILHVYDSADSLLQNLLSIGKFVGIVAVPLVTAWLSSSVYAPIVVALVYLALLQTIIGTRLAKRAIVQPFQGSALAFQKGRDVFLRVTRSAGEGTISAIAGWEDDDTDRWQVDWDNCGTSAQLSAANSEVIARLIQQDTTGWGNASNPWRGPFRSAGETGFHGGMTGEGTHVLEVRVRRDSEPKTSWLLRLTIDGITLATTEPMALDDA